MIVSFIFFIFFGVLKNIFDFQNQQRLNLLKTHKNPYFIHKSQLKQSWHNEQIIHNILLFIWIIYIEQ